MAQPLPETKPFTLHNVIEYLREEGFQPERDLVDDKIITFRYQGNLLIIGVVDNFCKICGRWQAPREEVSVEAMHTASMAIMNEYRFIRIIYIYDALEYSIDNIVTSMEQFKELFEVALLIINECRTEHRKMYQRLLEVAADEVVADEAAVNEASNSDNGTQPRHDIYYPEFRWLPDVLFKAVSTKQILPEALTDEDWIRTNIQDKTASAAMAKEWESFKINRVENFGDYKLIVYQFPEPKIVPEAKYGAVLLNTDSMELNYYTLEKSFDDKWVYGSMTTERHTNYGSYDTSDVEKFIEWIFSNDKSVEGGVDYTKNRQSN